MPAEDDIARVKERFQLHDPFVLYVGNIRPHKNVERLIEAFALVRTGPLANTKLLIIGDEISKYPTLRRAVHTGKLHKHVRFLGYVGGDTLAALYRLATVFAFPSLYEGFGLPPLEAMASGTPVVTSNVSSLPEVVGDAAILVDPREPTAIAHGLRRALLDPVLRERMRERGLARAQHYSWARTTQTILRIYRETAGAQMSAGELSDHARAAWLPGPGAAPRPTPPAATRTGGSPSGPGPRLADRNARRRTRARGPLPDVSGRLAAHLAARARHGLGRHLAPPSRDLVPAAGSAHLAHLPAPAAAVPAGHREPRRRRCRSGDLDESLRGQVDPDPARHPAPLLLLHAGAVRLGSVRRLLRTGAGRPTPRSRDADPARPLCPLGPAHQHPTGPLCGDLSICCAEDPAIL